MKRILFATVAATALLAVPAQAGSGTSVVIRHQVRGCHAWSVNGGPYKASQIAQIKRGRSIMFMNNDVMPHKLVKLQGPAVVVHNAAMARMGAMATVKFTHAGTYVFKTKAGEDYKNMKHIATKGKDNVLRLTIHVG
jgi:plastocyanin